MFNSFSLQMSQKVIYILHKNGAKGHYIALDYLLQKNSIILKHREFSVFSNLFKSITKFKIQLFKKQLKNISFFILILFSKNKKIVLGIAPFDSKLILVLKLLKKHKIYYHTSWTKWDKTFHPKLKNNSPKVYQYWQMFLEQNIEHIFAVTEKSKQEILDNYKVKESKISVVNHAISDIFFDIRPKKKRPNSFIYVGRLLSQKGILEILNYFKLNKNATLTIVGNGDKEETVLKYAETYKNITYLNSIYNKTKLIDVYNDHEYFILNSKKTKTWEELFGIVIIESLALGIIPIASSHSGPKEIISKNNGYLFNEGDLKNVLDKVISKNFDESMSKNNMREAEKYSLNNISKKWQPILH